MRLLPTCEGLTISVLFSPLLSTSSSKVLRASGLSSGERPAGDGWTWVWAAEQAGYISSGLRPALPGGAHGWDLPHPDVLRRPDGGACGLKWGR